MPEEQRVTPGQPIKTNPLVRHSNTINTVLDMADRFRAQGYLGSPGDKNRRGDMGTDEVQVRNMTGAARLMGDVVQLGGFILDEKVYPHLWFDAQLPESLRKIAILRQPLSILPEPEIGRASTAGVCIARFSVQTGEGDWATPAVGSHALTLADSGPFEVLSSIVDGLAVVRFHADSTAMVLVRLEEDLCPVSFRAVGQRNRFDNCPSGGPCAGDEAEGDAFPAASARIVNCATMLTRPGGLITVVDPTNKLISRGTAAEGGDAGGGSCADANLIWAQRCQGGDYACSDQDTYLAVSGGTYYRKIEGVLTDNQIAYPWRVYLDCVDCNCETQDVDAADIVVGFDGEFLYGVEYDENYRPFITLTPRCGLEPESCAQFWAELNACGRYEVYNWCCPDLA